MHQMTVLQIENKELKSYLMKQGEEKENIVRQLEQLNIENVDLQNSTRSLEDNLQSAQGERDALHDTLRKTLEICSQQESTLSSNKCDEQKYEQKLDELQNRLTQAEAASAAAILAVTEKEKAIQDSVQMELKLQNVVAGLQSQSFDSTSQISKLIDQLSIASREKATLAAKFESVTMELSIMKGKAEAQAIKISQLESSLESLIEERDAAYSRVAELLAATALPSEYNELVSNADEREKTIQSLKAGAEQALTEACRMEGTMCELQRSKSEIADLKTRIEVTNQEQKQSEQSNIEAEAKIEALQLQIDGLSNLKSQIEKAEISKSKAEAKIKALQSECDELKAVNTELAKANTTADSQSISYSIQSTEAINDLMKDLAEVNSNFQRLKRLLEERLGRERTRWHPWIGIDG